MQDLLRKFTSFNAVSAGQTANISVPVGGPVYEGFFIKHMHNPGTGIALATQAEIAANVTRVHVKVNGDTLVDLTGAELIDWNNYYKYPVTPGYFMIPFVRCEFIDVAEELRFALGTVGVRQVSVEVTLAAGVVSPSLEMWGKITQGVQRPLGQVIRVRSTSFSAQTAAGVREIHDLPILGPEAGRGIKALHIKAANVSEHQILRSGLPINEAEKELLNLWADVKGFQTGGRAPQAGYYHVDFTGNRASGIISTQNISDFRLKLTFAAADPAFSIITEETIGGADQ